MTQRTIHDEVAEKVKLATTYATDGAFLSAARIYFEIAKMYEERADFWQVEMERGPKPREVEIEDDMDPNA